MRKLLSSEQLDEVRVAVSFLQSSPLAQQIKLLFGHVDAQAELIQDQAALIAGRDLTIAQQARDIEAGRTKAARDAANPTYQRDIAEGRAIRCPRCGWVSHNENDVAEKYCGHCHQFHAFMALEASGGS